MVQCHKCGEQVVLAAQFNDVIVCSDCLDKTSEMIRKTLNQNGLTAGGNSKQGPRVYSPSQIIEMFNQSVIGQDEAKAALALAVSMHTRGARGNYSSMKHNTIIMGKTGSGKTELARVLARNLEDYPVIQVDASSWSPTGYVGLSVSSMLSMALNMANGDIEKAERSIIFIDEIDKIGRSKTSDMFKSEMVQQELLKILEGAEIPLMVKTGNQNGDREIVFNTKKILFIGAGAFEGIGEISGLTNSKQIDLVGDSDSKEWEAKLTKDHIVKFGFTPEFVGRFTTLTKTNPITKEMILNILKSSDQSPVKYYRDVLWDADRVRLSFADEVLDSVSEKAMKESFGVRSLKEEILNLVKPVIMDIEKYQESQVLITMSGPVMQEIDKKSLLSA
nr:ATP-dependent Clp protease ATP-binding subunit ClpX [Bdellovibrio sp. HM001]